jgi:uncharacterized protein
MNLISLEHHYSSNTGAMQSINMQPIQQKQRIAIVDILRGWALLGVVLMNYVDYYLLGINGKTGKPDLLTNILGGVGQVIFSAKSWTMLSFLFGYGFAVLMASVASKGMNAGAFFSRRMFWLFVLAIINSTFFFGDILKDYAMMGMVLLLFYKVPVRVTFITSIALLLLMPAVAAYVNTLPSTGGGWSGVVQILPLLQSHNILNVARFQLEGTYRFEFLSLTYVITIHVAMLACFLLGLSAQRINFFGRIHENKKYVKRLFWGLLGGTLFLLAYMIFGNKLKLNIGKYYQPGLLFVISNMLFYVAAICWLYVSGKLKSFFRSMQVIGKMTLTNYMTQNLLAILLFSGFGFGWVSNNRLHLGYYWLFAFGIYIAQVYFSKWWLARYYYGPIEWVWRQLSYNKRLPIKKQAEDKTEVSTLEPVLIPAIE